MPIPERERSFRPRSYDEGLPHRLARAGDEGDIPLQVEVRRARQAVAGQCVGRLEGPAGRRVRTAVVPRSRWAAPAADPFEVMRAVPYPKYAFSIAAQAAATICGRRLT